MTDRVQTVALMAATLVSGKDEWSNSLAVECAVLLLKESERQVAAAYPAPTSKELPKCKVGNPQDCGIADCPRHGA